MSYTYITCRDLRYVKSLSGNLTGVFCATPAWQVGILYPALVNISLQLSPSEITEMFSALMAGADILYPEKNQELLWLFWRALECPPERVLFADDFVIEQAAPATSPRTDQPKGELLLTQINGAQWKIDDGALVVANAGTFSGFPASLRAYPNQYFNRASGICAKYHLLKTQSTGIVHFGWYPEVDNSFQDEGATISVNYGRIDANINNVNAPDLGDIVANVQYSCAIVLDTTRAYVLILGGAYQQWTLLFVYSTWQYAGNMQIAYSSTFVRVGDAARNIRVANLGGRWAADNGIADINAVTVSQTDTLVFTSDFVMEANVGTVSATDKIILVRAQDNDNCWKIVFNSTSTTLYERVAGSDTLRSSGGAIPSNTQICMVVDGQRITLNRNNTQPLRYLAAANFINETAFIHVSGDSILSLSQYPRRLPTADAQEVSLA